METTEEKQYSGKGQQGCQRDVFTLPTAYRYYGLLHRVPGFLSSRPNWLPLPPHLQANVASSLLVSRGRGHTRLREGGQTIWCQNH
jgi:hypothetical protein